jgi:putative ABC transport system substrate-binding protein
MRFHRRLVTALLVLAFCGIGKVEAQQPARVYKIGHLLVGTPTPQWGQLWDELRRLGYVEGQNLTIERRYPPEREQLAAAAAELLSQKPDVIVTGGTPAALTARQALATIPIVFSLGANQLQPGANPVDRGIIASYERPGGNITGFVEGVVPHKKLEILKEAVPSITRVACPCRAQIQTAIADAARRLGLELIDLDVLNLKHLDMQKPEHFNQFFEEATRAGANAALMPNLQGYGRFLPLAAGLATEKRLPAIGFGQVFVKSGGLLSYGPKEGEGQVVVAGLVNKILLGESPSTLPVVMQQSFTLAVNLKTAESLSLTVSQTVLSRADEVVR